MTAEPDHEVSSVVVGGNYWMSIMTQSSLSNEPWLSQCYKCWSSAFGWCCQTNHGLPQCCWLPDFPLTLLPWQQSPDSGRLNQDTWVPLISHVESLGYFPSPLFLWLPPSPGFGLSSFGTLVGHSGEGRPVWRVQRWPSKSASGSTLWRHIEHCY